VDPVNEDQSLSMKTEGFIGTVEKEVLVAELNVASGSNKDHWLVDSGATHRITDNKRGMTNVESIDEVVVVGNGKRIPVRERNNQDDD
jgi:hypothetical protein